MIRVDNLGKKLQDSSWLFSNLSFAVNPGEILYIRGASGSGKSTLLKILGRLVCPDTGSVEYCPTSRKNNTERKNFPYIHQKPVFWGESVEEHLGEPFRFQANKSLSFSPDLAKKYLSDLGFDGSSLLKRKPITLSGGEGQVVALVRSVLLRPHCLLLDEPDNALDSRRRQLFQKFIINWMASGPGSAVWITHADVLPTGAKSLLLEGPCPV